MLCPPKHGHVLAFGTVWHIQAMYFPAFFSALRTKHYGKNHHPAAKLSGITVADVKWSAPSEGVGVTVEIRRGCKLAPFVRETGERKACVVAILQTVTNPSVSTEHQKMVPQRFDSHLRTQRTPPCQLSTYEPTVRGSQESQPSRGYGRCVRVRCP